MEPNEGGNKLPTQPNPPNPLQNPPQQPHDYLSVHPFEIKYSNGQQKPNEPMRIPVVTPVQGISELFLPDSFLAKVAKCSNLYGKAKGHSFKPISTPNILVFFSIIYYMGLPAKTDYWKLDGMWPTHKAIGHMSYKCSQVIWHNIYLVKPDGADND